mmetsp:Transcript_77816/g.154346  ORF Transcript_77816/g.154346 Transcript_77816/m.154346 type:complete len:243 (+) Transcript_77816:388-1116(+)
MSFTNRKVEAEAPLRGQRSRRSTCQLVSPSKPNRGSPQSTCFVFRGVTPGNMKGTCTASNAGMPRDSSCQTKASCALLISCIELSTARMRSPGAPSAPTPCLPGVCSSSMPKSSEMGPRCLDPRLRRYSGARISRRKRARCSPRPWPRLSTSQSWFPAVKSTGGAGRCCPHAARSSFHTNCTLALCGKFTMSPVNTTASTLLRSTSCSSFRNVSAGVRRAPGSRCRSLMARKALCIRRVPSV